MTDDQHVHYHIHVPAGSTGSFNLRIGGVDVEVRVEAPADVELRSDDDDPRERALAKIARVGGHGLGRELYEGLLAMGWPVKAHPEYLRYVVEDGAQRVSMFQNSRSLSCYGAAAQHARTLPGADVRDNGSVYFYFNTRERLAETLDAAKAMLDYARTGEERAA